MSILENLGNEKIGGTANLTHHPPTLKQLIITNVFFAFMKFYS